MNKIAVAFLTKDRVELSAQSLVPLLNEQSIDIFWCDGSTTPHGIEFKENSSASNLRKYANVRGGAGAGIVFALTKMLEANYEYVALVENDVCLDPDWFDACLDLFRRGADDGLIVGAASARNYVDRVLFQRDGYSINHNTGAGMIMFYRPAAQLALNHFRSGYTTDNRRIFGRLSGVDISPFWAFKSGDHPLVADWAWDAMLASHGYASLALTPSKCKMIGQDPPLADQGLTLVTEPVASRIDDAGFNVYRARLQAVQLGAFSVNVPTDFHYDVENNGWNYAPHQFHKLGGVWSGELAHRSLGEGGWAFKEVRAFGEFGWVAQEAGAKLRISVAGTCVFIVGGGEKGGQVRVEDEYSGYHVAPYVSPEGAENAALQIPMPSRVPLRVITLTAMTAGICVYRMTCKERQATLPNVVFDHSCLPPPVVK